MCLLCRRLQFFCAHSGKMIQPTRSLHFNTKLTKNGGFCGQMKEKTKLFAGDFAWRSKSLRSANEIAKWAAGYKNITETLFRALAPNILTSCAVRDCGNLEINCNSRTRRNPLQFYKVLSSDAFWEI